MPKSLFLVLAGLALLAGSADAHCNYVIREGDNVFDIAAYNGFDNETELLELNPQITDPQLIYPGDTVRFPCKGGDADKGDSIYDLLEHRADLFTLWTALAKAGMLDGLNDGNLDATLFAPTDDAFAALLKQLDLSAAALLNDTSLLQDVLSYHVIPGESLEASDFRDGTHSYSTLLKGKKLKVRKYNDKVWVLTIAGHSVPVKVADLQAGDAIVHVIEEVLLPLGGEAPAGAPTSAPASCLYVVKANDSLFSIAEKYKTTVDSLLELNADVEDPELIQPGDKIVVCK